MLILLAQTAANLPDLSAISGSSGLVGCGLLGAVLSWLLFIHLPAKDKQIKELIDTKDKQIKEFVDSKDKQLSAILDKNWEITNQMGEVYKVSLAKVSEHCEKEITVLMEAWKREMDRLVKAMESTVHRS